jgi:DTW domain-containing protein
VVRVATQVVVVGHHVEIKKSTNTARLACIAIAGAELVLRSLPGGDEGTDPEVGRAVVLYPGAPRELAPTDRGAALLVPDGNWNQARHLARTDPLLARGELVRLPPGPPSRYLLRKEPNPAAISTFEAIARALGVLEGPEHERRLLEVFDRFVARAYELRFGTPPPGP